MLSGGQTGTEGSKRLERLQVYLEEDGSFSRPVLGNRIAAEGEMSAFSPARNPGEFDYRGYYRSLKLHYRMFADSWRVQKASVKWERECQYRLSVSIGRGAFWRDPPDILCGNDGGFPVGIACFDYGALRIPGSIPGKNL